MRRQGGEPDLIIETSDGSLILVQLKKIDVKQIRAKTGMSQPKFAERFGFGIQQLRTWEQNRAMPSASTLAYLALIEANPEGVATIFASSRYARPAARKARQRAVKPQSPPSPG